MRLVLIAGFSVFAMFTTADGLFGQGDVQRSWSSKVRPLIQASCSDCHSGAAADGSLDLESFATIEEVVDQRKLWKKIAGRVRDHQMPPVDGPELSDSDRQMLLDWIENELPTVACSHGHHAGSVTVRRLTRFEYANTIRELLGIEFDPSEQFPVDESGYGFDNIGDVLSVSPLLLEKYLMAAEAISSSLIFDVARHRIDQTTIASDLATTDGSFVVDGSQVLTTTGSLSVPATISHSGRYRITVEAWGQQAGNEVVEMGISADGKLLKRFKVRVDKENSRGYDFQTSLDTNVRNLEVTFMNDFYDPDALDKNRRDRNMGVNSIRIEGPIGEPAVSAVQKQFLFALPSDELSGEAAAEKIIKLHGSRAWRRPIQQSEIDELLALYQIGVEQGESFEGSMQLVVQALLVSPQFLFKVEAPAPDDGSPRRLDDYELATALSYFMWGTMPDNQLFERATRGELSNADNMKKEVGRLLADQRSLFLIENFASQWLQLRVLEQFDPDPERFAGYTPELRAAMVRETQLLLNDVLRHDAPLSTLLDSRYTWVNRALAQHYGMPEKGLSDEEFKRVAVGESGRGGLLTQASVLALTSNPTRTSPVKRGKWVLENLLADPPPPPLPDVPQLDGQHQLTGSLKQRMEQHRADPSCATCHFKMDSIGFALENFDAIGRFRMEDEGRPIDATGRLPGGKEFHGAVGLQRLILEENYEAFVRCFVQKLFTFALGRGSTDSDECIIDSIARDAVTQNKPVSRIIEDLVTSEPFQFRSHDVATAATRGSDSIRKENTDEKSGEDKQ